jgi:hypothetical protein
MVISKTVEQVKKVILCDVVQSLKYISLYINVGAGVLQSPSQMSDLRDPPPLRQSLRARNEPPIPYTPLPEGRRSQARSQGLSHQVEATMRIAETDSSTLSHARFLMVMFSHKP